MNPSKQIGLMSKDYIQKELRIKTIAADKEELSWAKDFIQYKLVMLGTASVGKTALVNAVFERPIKLHTPTLGVDAALWYLELETTEALSIKIVDTSGQERFANMVSSYVRDADGAVLVFDVSDKSSWEMLKKKWEPFVRENTKDVKCLVIGNKEDKEDVNGSWVNLEEVEKWCKSHSCLFATTSAFECKNVINLMAYFAQIIHWEIGRSPGDVSLKNTNSFRLTLDRETTKGKRKRSCHCIVM